MHMRLAGCVAGIMGVLGWEAMTAAMHPVLTLKPSAPVSEARVLSDPLAVLAEGVMAAPPATAERPQHGRTWSLAAPPESQTDSCRVAAVSACRGAAQPAKQDAGVAPVSASPAACQNPRKG
jgi:hypothetical protein